VLDERGALQAMTAPAKAWIADLVEPGFRVPADWLPACVHEVARRAQTGDGASNAHLRVRAASGHWLTLHGSHMIGANGSHSQTAVIISRRFLQKSASAAARAGRTRAGRQLSALFRLSSRSM
jgi:hypothetical protein